LAQCLITYISFVSFLSAYVSATVLLSFPTRRSSDLDALRAQLALDHHLRGDARMVGARLPQRVAALHAAEADQRVHDGVVEAMADRKSTRLNSSHVKTSYAVFCLKKKKI